MYLRKTTSKYHAQKTYVDGIRFDSKKEANRYIVLKQKEANGEIKNLKLQVPFTLIQKSSYGREIRYKADFTYYEGDELVVEDVKGSKATLTDIYKLKKRMMAELYGIVIREVF